MWAPGTRHQSISDTATWVPSPVGRKMGAMGESETMHETRLATAMSCHAHMQRALGAMQTASLSGHLQLGADLQAPEPPAVLHPFVFGPGPPPTPRSAVRGFAAASAGA